MRRFIEQLAKELSVKGRLCKDESLEIWRDNSAP